MTNIIDYKLVVEQSNITLDRIINDLIQDGWQPNGGVAVAVTESGAPYDKDSYYHIVYAQAMVKYEEKENIMDTLVGQAVMHMSIVPTSVDIPTSNHMSRFSTLYVSKQ